jgi:predicted SnoaL-like aldol condensation-catalyzing enzyme
MTDPLERNRKNALAFYDLLFNQCQPRRAVAEFVGETYIQHNPEVKEGKQGFVKYCEVLNQQYPGKQAKFLGTVCEGNLVVVHSHQNWPGESEFYVVDFFRFDDNGKIIEHWDVVQEISTE